MKENSVMVNSKRGDMEFNFSSILDRNKKDRSGVDTEMDKLIDYYKCGGNISVLTYGQKGIGKSGFLWSENNGFVINIVNKILTECPDNTEFEFSAIRVTNECVRIGIYGFRIDNGLLDINFGPFFRFLDKFLTKLGARFAKRK